MIRKLFKSWFLVLNPRLVDERKKNVLIYRGKIGRKIRVEIPGQGYFLLTPKQYENLIDPGRRTRSRRRVSPSRMRGPSEILVIPGLAEKFKALKMARQKEIEAMRDQ